ncbi:hypothetical protein EB796_019910 [Bugula neritina]|uniref:Uncharacterized protein n=1 Tax=Bugula neritina TaxID=10212 RepID=A0A7J7J781_BUGNE|nr:hypothetical protein EB796_019910 [Bugula neritina]
MLSFTPVKCRHTNTICFVDTLLPSLWMLLQVLHLVLMLMPALTQITHLFTIPNLSLDLSKVTSFLLKACRLLE